MVRPGSNVVTFICLCNFVLWVTYTLQAEKFIHNPIMAQVYGQIPWAFMVKTALPLMIFFRFHSIDVIGKIWTEVYHHEIHDEEEAVEVVVPAAFRKKVQSQPNLRKNFSTPHLRRNLPRTMSESQSNIGPPPLKKSLSTVSQMTFLIT